MSHLNCPQCGRFMISPENHQCSPQWEVGFGDTIDEAISYGIHTIYAVDILDAAETAAEEDDVNSGDYTIVRNGESKAWARKLGDTEWTELLVYGESVPQYTAYES